MNKTGRWLMACLGTMLLSVSSSNVVAAPIFTGGQLTGATDVNVGGTLYDVEFLDGSCIDLFSGCDSSSDFTFLTFPTAQAASRALLEQVFVNGAERFDSDSSLTLGCGSFICRVQTPFSVAFPTVTVYVAVNDPDAGRDGTLFERINAASSAADSDREVFARWRPNGGTPAPIPEPGALTLFALGLGGLMVASKSATRRHRD